MMAFDNQCDSCLRKTPGESAYCSMFLLRPTGPCGHHSISFIKVAQLTQQSLRRMQPGGGPKLGE